MEAATFIWMFLVLKVPVLAALLLIWWAIRDQGPATDDQDSDDDGGGGSRLIGEAPPRRPWPRRRGPHGDVQPPAPPRTRKPARARPIRTTR